MYSLLRSECATLSCVFSVCSILFFSSSRTSSDLPRDDSSPDVVVAASSRPLDDDGTENSIDFMMLLTHTHNIDESNNGVNVMCIFVASKIRRAYMMKVGGGNWDGRGNG